MRFLRCLFSAGCVALAFSAIYWGWNSPYCSEYYLGLGWGQALAAGITTSVVGYFALRRKAKKWILPSVCFVFLLLCVRYSLKQRLITIQIDRSNIAIISIINETFFDKSFCPQKREYAETEYGKSRVFMLRALDEALTSLNLMISNMCQACSRADYDCLYHSENWTDRRRLESSIQSFIDLRAAAYDRSENLKTVDRQLKEIIDSANIPHYEICSEYLKLLSKIRERLFCLEHKRCAAFIKASDLNMSALRLIADAIDNVVVSGDEASLSDRDFDGIELIFSEIGMEYEKIEHISNQIDDQFYQILGQLGWQAEQ